MARTNLNPARLAAFAAAVTVAAGLGARVTDPRVEYLISPLGVASTMPRFSWLATPNDAGDRNQSQTAFQLQVSGSAAACASGTSDVWDSGLIPGSSSSNVPYGGLPLQPGQRYFWRVSALISDCNCSTGFTPCDSFSVGLSSADWSATSSFIGVNSIAGTCPWMRRSFSLAADAIAAIANGTVSALLHVASVGYHEAWVNGMQLKSEDVLVPSVTNLGRVVPARTYDASAALVAGENVLGFWAAPGWADFQGVNPRMDFNITSPPLLRAELRITPAVNAGAGTLNMSIVTDGSWVWNSSRTSHIGGWTNSNFGGDSVNWASDIPGWSTPAVNDSAWESVVTVPLAREIVPEVLEPTRVIGVVPAASVVSCGTACALITMAELFTGWLNITSLVAPVGVQVTIQYSTNAGQTVEYNQVDMVTLSASDGSQGFCGRFSYHEMQYITVTGVSALPEVSNILGLRLMSARARVGSFNSSDALLNDIYAATVRTYEGLTTGGFTVDCPHRERLGYGGDAHTSMEMAMATFDSGAFFTKVAADWAAVQDWDGTTDLPHTAPTIDGGGGPGWGGYSITMPWHMFLVTGDLRALTAAYPTMIGFIDFLLSNVDASSQLLQPFGGSWGFLGDWLTPHGSENSGTPESILFNNVYMVYCLRIVVRVATQLGDTARATQYAAAAANISAGVHAAFYVNASASYLDTRQTHQVMPLIAGVVPAPLQASVQATLAHEIVVTQGGHFDTGLHGTYFLIKYLTDPAVSRVDLLLLMARQTTGTGYGQMLAAGYTTWPEQWGGAPSRMHGCLNGIGLAFNQALLGVRVDATAAPADAHTYTLVIPPWNQADATLSWAAGSTATPYGAVNVSWSVNASSATYAAVLSVPVNTFTLLTMPWAPSSCASTPCACVCEGGMNASLALGVAFVSSTGNMSVWRVQSGTYAFQSVLM